MSCLGKILNINIYLREKKKKTTNVKRKVEGLFLEAIKHSFE
jgi:hypothetical protein